MKPMPEQARVHIRWMIRRDMPEVLAIDDMVHNGWTEADFLTVLRQRNCIGTVAEHGEHVVGLMIYELHKYSLRVINFAVHPKWKKLGIGAQMVAKLKSKLSSHRRIAIQVIVPEKCLDMLLFLKRMGFKAKSMQKGAEFITMVHALRGHESESVVPTNRLAKFFAEDQS